MSPQRETTTVIELLRNRVRKCDDAVACCRRTDAQVWVPTSWSELWDKVERVSGSFQRMGVRKGDRIAIIARTCSEWQVAEMAGLLIGAVIVGVDPHATAEHVEHTLRHSGACCLLVDDGNRVEKMSRDVLAKLQFMVGLSQTAKPADSRNWYLWDELASACSPQDDFRSHSVAADDPATLLYTSGTTGRPKAIQFTHRQLIVACRAIGHALPEIVPGDSMLCWLPMAHLFQRMMNLFAIDRGTKTYFVTDPREVMTCVREVHPSLFVAVPRFYEKLYDEIMDRVASSPPLIRRVVEAALRTGSTRARYERAGQRPPLGLRLRHPILTALVLRKIRAVMGKKIKIMITGSAPTPPWLLEFFHGIGLLVLEAYGVSENTVPMAGNLSKSYRFGSVGKPFPENEIQFADDGEILVRGPGVFRGYYGDEDQNEPFTDDGFYRSGDFGRMDADGFLYLTGRKSDIIKTSTGRRISPARIEAVYCQSPLLDQVVVIGNGRKHLVALIVVRRPSIEHELAHSRLDLPFSGNDFVSSPVVETLVRREIESYGRNLAPHERIVNFAVLPEPLSVARGELTPNLKVRRDRVSTLYSDLIERLYKDAAG